MSISAENSIEKHLGKQAEYLLGFDNPKIPRESLLLPGPDYLERMSYGKLDERIYTTLTSNHPIDLCRYQVANCYMGRIGLINSGGASGANNFSEAVATAVINNVPEEWD